MKKIMFNDKFGLTKAVLEGRKTMTRRIVPGYDGKTIPYGGIDGTRHFVIADNEKLFKSVYAIGEVVAVAQSYKDLGHPDFLMEDRAGWNNKMFVSALMCYHHIRITNVRVERLQDISDEDCLREGIYETKHHSFGYPPSERQRTFQTAVYERFDAFSTPRHAFAALIDRVCRKGTWASNPWVFVYEFELVK